MKREILMKMISEDTQGILDTDTSDLMKEARDWLIYCFPDLEEDFEDVSDDYILHIIESNFDGGLVEFIRSGR